MMKRTKQYVAMLASEQPIHIPKPAQLLPQNVLLGASWDYVGILPEGVISGMAPAATLPNIPAASTSGMAPAATLPNIPAASATLQNIQGVSIQPLVPNIQPLLPNIQGVSVQPVLPSIQGVSTPGSVPNVEVTTDPSTNESQGNHLK